MVKFQIQNLSEVPEALGLVTEEVKTVKKAINEAGAKAQREDKRQIAREALDYADGLDNFVAKVEELKREWQRLEERIARATPEAREIVRSAGGTRVITNPPAPKTGLKVTFPDGTVLHDSVAAVTFVKALSKLGPEKVAEIGETLNYEPLVSKKRGDFKKHPQAIRALGKGWFASTYCSTSGKAKALRRIAGTLGIQIQVEQVEGVFAKK